MSPEVPPHPTRPVTPWLPTGLYLVLAVLATWPLAARLSTYLPLGSLENATVPLFNLWTFEWNTQALARGYSGYWDAPIFYPTQGTFALSEAQAITGAAFAVLRAAVSGVTAYNVLLLLALTFNALAARRLMRVLGASDGVATAVGCLALGMSFVWKELGVLQLTMLWPVWLVLGELALLSGARGALKGEGGVETSSPAAALLRLALWCAVLAWTCTYYALFIGVFLLLAIGFFVRREFFAPPLRRAGLLALLFVVASAYPLLAQQRVVASYARSTKTIHDGGATARAYTRYPKGALGGHVLPLMAAPANKRALNPGVSLVLLAAAGVWSQLGRRTPSTVRRSRFFVWCAVCLVVGLILSFGARWSIGSFRPYEVLLERYVPGFGNARSPYRFAAFVQIFIVVFAGAGLEMLRHRVWRGRQPGRRRGLLLGAAVALAFLEVLPVGSRLERFPHEALQASWIGYLAQHPGGAVAMVPPALSGRVEAFEPTALAMLQGLRHGHPLLNGYSGFFPSKADAQLDVLKTFPDPRSKRVLGRVPVRYVVVDKAWLATRPSADLTPLTRVFDSASHAVYQVPEIPTR